MGISRKLIQKIRTTVETEGDGKKGEDFFVV